MNENLHWRNLVSYVSRLSCSAAAPCQIIWRAAIASLVLVFSSPSASLQLNFVGALVNGVAPSSTAPIPVLRGQRVALDFELRRDDGSLETAEMSVTIEKVAGGWLANTPSLPSNHLPSGRYRAEFFVPTLVGSAPFGIALYPKAIVTSLADTIHATILASNTQQIRVDPPTYGLTVVIHGFQPPTEILNGCAAEGDMPPKDFVEIGLAIRDRAGKGRLWDFNYQSNTIKPISLFNGNSVPPLESSAIAGAGEDVIVVNWCEVSNNASPGHGEAVAQALYAAMRAFNPAAAIQNFDDVGSGLLRVVKPIHIVAHSFGASVAYELSKRLAKLAGQTQIEVTTLDPHDFSQGLYFDTGAKQPNVKWLSIPELSTSRFDNYFQTNTISNPRGRPVSGVLNRDVSGRFNLPNGRFVPADAPGGGDHTLVHRLYLATIRPDDISIGNVKYVWFDAVSQFQYGYATSRIGGRISFDTGYFSTQSGEVADGTDLEVMDGVRYPFDDFRVFNGGFDPALVDGTNLPGFKGRTGTQFWDGATLSVVIAGTAANLQGRYLETHLTYVAPTVQSFRFKSTVRGIYAFDASANASYYYAGTPTGAIAVQLSTPNAANIANNQITPIGSFQIAGSPVGNTVSNCYPVPSGFRGKATNIRVVATGNGAVSIDDLELLASTCDDALGLTVRARTNGVETGGTVFALNQQASGGINSITSNAANPGTVYYNRATPPTQVVVTAPLVDASGNTFSQWLYCSSASSRLCTVTMDQARGVEAIYQGAVSATTYPITAAVSGPGVVTSPTHSINCGATCTASVDSGSTITLIATANSGGGFVSWTNCPNAVGATCSFNVTAARTVTANFGGYVQLTVAKIGTGLVTSALGAIDCGSKCSAGLASGTSVTLTASNVAGSGYTFSSWSNCPVTPSGATCGPFVNSADKSVTATFAPAAAQCVFSASPAPSTVTVGSGGTGYSVTLASAVGCAVIVTNSNPSACVTNVASITPGTGSTVLSIVVQTTTSARSCTIGVSGLSGSFVFNQAAPATTIYTITRQVATDGALGNFSGGSVGLVTCIGGSVIAGASCSLTATAQPGYAFSTWTENGVTISNSATYSFIVSGNRTLTANFVTFTTYASYQAQIFGPAEGRLSLYSSCGWIPSWVTDGNFVNPKVGCSYSVVCSTVPNWTLTSIFNQNFTAQSGGGALQCIYAQSELYLSPVTAVATQSRFAAGAYNSVARAFDGRVLSWGYGGGGALGDGRGSTVNPSLKPNSLAGITNVSGVRSDRFSTRQSVLLGSGTVMAWGFGDIASGGGDSSSATSVPTAATLLGNGIQKLFGASGFGVLRTDGQAALYNNGALTSLQVPANVVDISESFAAIHALDREGRVWSLNYGQSGTVGNPVPYYTGISNYYSSPPALSQQSNIVEIPTPLPGLTRVIALTSTGYNTFAVKADGTVWVWGNQGDLLGTAAYPRATYPSYEPVQIPVLQNIKAISGGDSFVLAIDTSGNVWSWGANGAGQLGRTVGASSAVPAVVTGLTGVAEISAGSRHALAMKTDGTLWAWGANTYGMLGDNTTTDSVTPVQVRCPSGTVGFVNLLSDACTVNATNVLSIAAYIAPANLPTTTRVLVNGSAVSPPYQVSLPATSTATLDITAPTGFAGALWRGDIDTGATNVVQLSLPMNRDWSLIPYVAACQFFPLNDSLQLNIPASGTTFSPNVSLPGGTSAPKPIFNSRCAWDATPAVPWLRAAPANGSGSPVVTTVTVDANPTTVQRSGTMLIGGVTYTFTQLPAAGDSVPNAFAFTAASQIPINTFVISNSVTVAGINVAAPVSIAGGGEYSVNGGAYASAAGTVNLGDVVTVRQISSGSYSTLTSAVLTIGGVSATFNVTTTSAPVVINGNCGASNGGVFSSAPTTNLCLAGTATAVTGAGPWSWSCTGVNGGTTASCSAVPIDTTPDPFAFVAQSVVALNAPITSNTITIAGINSPAPISIVGGTYSIGCTTTFTSVVGTINDSQAVCVRHTSSGTNATAVVTTLTVGGVASTFTSTTSNFTCSVDVVGSGTPLATPDGLLLLRYMLGFRGNALTQGLSISGPRSAIADIEAFLAASDYSATGTAGRPTNVDGLIFLRLLQGVPDSALLNGINVPAGAAFRDAAAIRANVNARCGTAF